MTRYLIIDDEYIAHDIIKGYCDLMPDFSFMKSCYDAIEAITYLNNNEVDLIFLDLNMPKLTGFEFLRTLNHPPKVIVTTAYQEFALEGYELNIIDYLLKPFSFERFLKAINKASSSDNKPLEKGGFENENSSIFLQSNKKHIQVKLNDILYIEAAGNYSKIFTISKMISVREKISDLVKSLPLENFVQVHKSFAVSKQHIESIEGNRITIGEYIVPIGSTYKRNIKELLS